MSPRILLAAIALLSFSLPQALLAQTPAEITSPVAGSTLTVDSLTFKWTAATGALKYTISVGSTKGAKNYFTAATGTTPSAVISTLPANGGTFYVRLTTQFSTGSINRDYTYKAAKIPRVLLFLHGMNSTPGTWSVTRADLNLGTMPTIKNGVASATATADPGGKNIYAYGVTFGAFDVTSKRKGLEGVAGATNYATRGDFETFTNLGTEINAAIGRILALHPKAEIILVGHSRGGLAGRAFLQDPASKAASKAAVKGFVTIGTPHLGSRFGRLNAWLATHPRDPLNHATESADWQVADAILTNGSLDVRRPTVDDLSDLSSSIVALKTSATALPATISYYGIAYNGYSLGTLDPSYNIFTGLLPFVPPFTADCKTNLLSAGKTPANYLGDGIVPTTSQKFPGKTSLQISKNMLHNDETDQSTDILNGLGKVCGWFH